MEFEVDRAGGVPVYVQLARQVREALRLGWLRPGDRLPTVREVVAASRVNPNTVLKAYRLLESEGLVEGRVGAGTYVKASLGSVAPEAMARLLVQCTRLVQEARTAGMEDEDIYALVGAVLSEKETEQTT
ncbi:GntR family transcriptional regulator [Amycolatopsis sp.]|uniref:GntR family transcriptional regulator n=1 Tax=Amycolatopsis sp. TaxID=37632 RepID=UPI00262C1B0C|nr:GntR family transcriptional regulator [Amycolatopsis sp.]